MSQVIESIARESIAPYVAKQIDNLLPLGADNDHTQPVLELHLDEALTRVQRCIDEVSMWRVGHFDVLHSTQYCIFIYYLANTIWKREGDRAICTKLFLLNKALNAIDLFYEIEMPEVFFIGHSAGIVLAKASYGNHLVLYQNSTVGKNHGEAPVISNGVIMYPNTAIIGRSNVAKNSVISQGVSVINSNTTSDSIVFSGVGGELVCKPCHRLIQADFFRDYS